MNTLLQDLRYAARQLLKSPGFAAAAALSLGLGIGATTTIFSWMDALVLHPLPRVHEPERLVQVETATPDGRGSKVSYPDYLAWREQARSLRGLAAHSWIELSLRARGEAERVWGELASENYFDVLGVRPALGRTFTAEDARPGAPPVAVISDWLWRGRFAADPGIVGRHVFLNNQEVTVVGVAPPGFGGIDVGVAMALWVPITTAPLFDPHGGRLQAQASRWLDVVGRLRPGTTLEQARAELRAIGDRVAQEIPSNRGLYPSPVPLGAGGLQEMLRPLFLALLGVTAVLLLIACANVANLLLARASVRQREIGIRFALGANRSRVAGQLLVESMLLALLGGTVGVAVAFWGSDLLRAFIPANPFPVAIDPVINPRVLGVAALITFGTAIFFGLAPALRASRPDLMRVLKTDTPGAGTSRSRLRGALVAAQIALALVALVSAGLFVRSLREMQRVNPGFRDPAHVLLVPTNLHLAGYTGETGPAFAQQLLERARALPGVESASLATSVPLGFGGYGAYDTTIEGYTPGERESTSVNVNVVAPGYFETMGTPLVRGRVLGAGDREDAPLAVVVNESFARRFWPGQDPVGRRIKHTYTGLGWMTVVGVAADGKYQQLNEDPQPFVFLAYPQRYDPEVTLLLRTHGDPAALVPAVRRLFTELNPGLPIIQPRTLEQHMGAAFFLPRIGAGLLGAFGLVALVLAAVGLYGVLAFLVSRRTRDIGIRLALGAAHRDVFAAVLRDSTRLTVVGLAAGLLLALAVARLLQGQLFQVRSADPLTLVASTLLLTLVALLASYLPARRATRVDPMIALRSE